MTTQSTHVTLVLPRLVGSREAVCALLDELGPVDSRTVILNARDLRSASPSAADEFVEQVLLQRGGVALEVAGAPENFLRDLSIAAATRGVTRAYRELELERL